MTWALRLIWRINRDFESASALKRSLLLEGEIHTTRHQLSFPSRRMSPKEMIGVCFASVIVPTMSLLIVVFKLNPFLFAPFPCYHMHKCTFPIRYLSVTRKPLSLLAAFCCCIRPAVKLCVSMCASVSGETGRPVLLTLASLFLLLVLYYGVECVSDNACSLFGLCSQSSISGSCVPGWKTNINANLVAINAF